MIRKIIRGGIALALGLCMAIPNAYALSGAESGDQEYDGYLVKLKDGIPQQSLSLLEDGDGGSESGLIVVDSLEEALDIPEELVEYIEPNYLVELFAENEPADTPSDPYYAAYQWNLQTIHAYEAYRRNLTGSGVKVGFVDSGIILEHEDLNAELISGENFNTDGLAYYEDTYGHGTFAAGIVAAQTNNSLGLAGIAPDVELHAYANWITSGVSVTKFCTGQLTTPVQYIVFMLRALGYRSGEDFAWNEAKAFAEQIGLLRSGWDIGDRFTRGDAAELSWLALGTETKGGTETLADKLIQAGVFTADEYEFAQLVAELGLAETQEAEQSRPGRPPSGGDHSGSGSTGGSSSSGSSGSGSSSSGSSGSGSSSSGSSGSGSSGSGSGGSSSSDSGGSSGDSSGSSSGGNPDKNETEDIPLF